MKLPLAVDQARPSNGMDAVEHLGHPEPMVAAEILRDAGRRNADFAQSLSNLRRRLLGATDAKGASKVIDDLINETVKMIETSRSTERMLKRLGAHVREKTVALPIVDVGNTENTSTILKKDLFEASLRETVMHCIEIGDALSLLLVEVDRFDEICSRFGAEAGVRILQDLSALLFENIKGQDTALACGDTAHAVILPSTELEGAVKLASVICDRAASQLRVSDNGDQRVRVSVSIGVAQFALGEPLSELVGRASESLVVAQNNGRNRVVFSMKDNDGDCTIAC